MAPPQPQRPQSYKPKEPAKPKRERTQTGSLSAYRFFWKGSKWHAFLRPTKVGGFEGAKSEGLAYIQNQKLEQRPGVYEFAITTRQHTDKRIKVYIGETGNMKQRMEQYGDDGDHIRAYLDAALKDGYLVWRRLKYLKTKELAVAKEAKFLETYDYAWNAKDNGSKRQIKLKQTYSCCCFCSALEVIEKPALREKLPPRLQPEKPGGSSSNKLTNFMGSMKNKFGSSKKSLDPQPSEQQFIWARS